MKAGLREAVGVAGGPPQRLVDGEDLTDWITKNKAKITKLIKETWGRASRAALQQHGPELCFPSTGPGHFLQQARFVLSYMKLAHPVIAAELLPPPTLHLEPETATRMRDVGVCRKAFARQD